MREVKNFNITLAIECASSFSITTGLGCVVSLADGTIVYEKGYGCSSCKLCYLIGLSPSMCVKTHIYGMLESERFGGKYIYYGPTGLTYLVSPIIGDESACAKITVGPFLLVDKDDYIDIDLVDRLKITPENLKNVIDELNNIPVISAEKITHFSNLLFMSVGFMNDVNELNKMIETDKSYAIQKHLTHYIMQLKNSEDLPLYPFDIENKLLECISKSDRDGVKKYLNEILGFILLSTGNNLLITKSRVYELLVLISRKSINSGADPEKTLWLCHDYLQVIPGIQSIDELCLWLTSITNGFMDNLFTYMDVKHENVIHKTIQYIYKNYYKKITLETIAREAFLSPSYFSRVFKQETGIAFNDFLNNIRVEKSKELFKDNNLKIVDVSHMVGFDDQSYFTNVFKKRTGLTPRKFREINKNK